MISGRNMLAMYDAVETRQPGRRDRIDLLGDAAAADDLAPFEHQRAQPGARQVERRRQSVVTAPMTTAS